MKPKPELLVTVLENRPCSYGIPKGAFLATAQPSLGPIELGMSALRTFETFRPSDPLKVLPALLLGVKPIKELLKVFRTRMFKCCFHAVILSNESLAVNQPISFINRWSSRHPCTRGPTETESMDLPNDSPNLIYQRKIRMGHRNDDSVSSTQ